MLDKAFKMAARDAAFKNEALIIPESLLEYLFTRSGYNWGIKKETLDRIQLCVAVEKLRLKIPKADGKTPVESPELETIKRNLIRKETFSNKPAGVRDFLLEVRKTMAHNSSGYNLVNALDEHFGIIEGAKYCDSKA